MSELDGHTAGIGEGHQTVERAIATLLLASGGVPWTTDELVRELGERVAVLDGIDRLTRAGIVHRCGELVLASRAARELDAVLT